MEVIKMNTKERVKDTEFLWNVFKNTGLIGVYLMYEEKNKEISDKVIMKRIPKDKDGKRIKEII